MPVAKKRVPPPSVRAVSQERLREFGEIMRRIRESRGWTLREAARRCDLSVETLHTLEEGRKGSGVYNVPQIHTLLQIEEGYGLPLPVLTAACYGISLTREGAEPIPIELYAKLKEAAEILARQGNGQKSAGEGKRVKKGRDAGFGKESGRSNSFRLLPEFERIMHRLMSSD